LRIWNYWIDTLDAAAGVVLGSEVRDMKAKSLFDSVQGLVSVKDYTKGGEGARHQIIGAPDRRETCNKI